MNQSWQYKVQTFKLGWKGFAFDQIEKELNALGSDGWDVVGTIAPSHGSGQVIEIAVIAKRSGPGS